MNTQITFFVFSFLSFQLELCNLLFSVRGIVLDVQDVKANWTWTLMLKDPGPTECHSPRYICFWFPCLSQHNKNFPA